MHHGTLHIKPYRIFTVVCFAMSVIATNRHHSNSSMLYTSNNYACPEATCVSKSYFFSSFSKHMWLFGGIEGRNRERAHIKWGHRLHLLRVENGAPFQHAESARQVSTPSQRAGKHNAPACKPSSGERGATSPGHG